MQSKATTVDQYIAELPEDRRAAISAIRKVIRASVDKGVEEGMQYGMIGYFIPHSIYPNGYHCDPRQPLPFVCLASQKNYISIYLMSVYSEAGEENWFRKQWEATGRKLNMGKCCIRFRKLEDAALDVIADAIRRVPIARHIATYEAALNRPATKRADIKARVATEKEAKAAAAKARAAKSSSTKRAPTRTAASAAPKKTVKKVAKKAPKKS